MRLFIMEFKHLMFSKTFLFYCLLIIIFTVLNCQQVLKHPINSDVYQPQNMTMYSTDKNIIMSNEIKELKNEVHQNNFKTYQFGFLKQKKLNDQQISKIKKLISKMEKTNNFHQFKNYSNSVSHVVGWGSQYSENNISLFGIKNMSKSTYVKEKNIIKNKEYYYGAYSRYFSDIMGVVLGILPFFLGAQMILQDKKSNAIKTIHSKSISSYQLISTRVFTILVLAYLPVLLVSIYFVTCLSMIHQISMFSFFIFYKILILWTLPTLIFTIAMGLFVTIILNSYLGVMIQIVIWFINLNIGSRAIEGYYGSLLIPRHNTLFNAVFFYNHFNQILANRFTYFGLGLLLILLSTYIFDLKRRGVGFNGKIFTNRYQN